MGSFVERAVSVVTAAVVTGYLLLIGGVGSVAVSLIIQALA